MTLILFIPHKQGCILIGDRQNSYLEQEQPFKDEVTKLYLHSEKGPALGCSGDTELIRTLYTRLRTAPDVTNSNAWSRIKSLLMGVCDDLGKMASTSIGSYLMKIDMLIVKTNDGKISALAIHGLVEDDVDATRVAAIPTGNPEIKKFSNIETSHLSGEQAISLGEEIIRQMCFSSVTIGPPEYHGYDIVRVSSNGDFTLVNKPPTLKRLTPSTELLRKVTIEEEG